MHYWLLWILLIPASVFGQSEPVAVQSIERDGHIIFTAQFTLAVSQAQAFAVLTDFDHMAEFMPNMNFSKVLSRDGSHWHIKQQGRLQLGVLGMDVESERDIEIISQEVIHSRSLNDQHGAFISKMQLQSQSGLTAFHYWADWTPNSALMRSLGTTYFKQQIAQQFSAMQLEMLKRERGSLGRL